MKIKDIALIAAYVGQRVVKAIAVGAQEIWSAVKYIIFADPVVEQICANKWGDGVGITEEQAAAVTNIPRGVFESNADITTFAELVEFTSLLSLGPYAFADCRGLINIQLPTSLQTIGERAFRYCSFETFAGNEGLTDIGSHAFYGCASLKTIILPSTVVAVASNAFAVCASVQTVYIDNLEHWMSIQFSDLASVPGHSASQTVTIYTEDGEVTNVVVPSSITTVNRAIFSNNALEGVVFHEGVTAIGEYAFNNCIGLRSITLPNNIQTIGTYAFNNTRITSVDIPASLSVIVNRVFRQCTSLSSVTFYEGLTRIEDAAFYGCPITNLDLPSTVTHIGNTAFHIARGIIICRPVTPPTLGSGNFPGASVIYVPDESVEAYKTASNWSTYADKIKPLSEYVES